MTTENELERNVRYVINVFEKQPTTVGYSLFDLTLKVRLIHNRENPLGLKDAREAITEAEKRRLIREVATRYFGERYILNN